MKISDYTYPLPKDLIASRPLGERDASCLLVMDRTGRLEHRSFSDLPDLLDPGDMVIANNSRVIPARVHARKPSGDPFEMLLVKELSPGTWTILSRGKYTGTVSVDGGVEVSITGGEHAEFHGTDDVPALLRRTGEMPIPPYLNRRPEQSDRNRYQTVYAEIEGSIAAPTAGLHFTGRILERFREKRIRMRFITLHVGVGTFKPIRSAEVDEHVMDDEYFEILPGLLAEIEETRNSGNRVLAVGTTTTRALEGFFSGKCRITAENGCIRGTTDIFIREGHEFRSIDALLTNFHLPGSTPLILTAAFAGRENLLNAYHSAISRRYRFFSYGDAMLVL